MSRFKYFIILIYIFHFSDKENILSAANLQDSIYYAIEAKYQYGFTIPHHPDMFYQISDYTRSGEINVVRRRYKSQFWESNTRRLETGVGLWFSSLGQNDLYGHVISIFPFINLHLFNLGKLSTKSRVALGLGYANKPYDKYKNPYNNALGSHFNAYIGLGFMLYYPIIDKITLHGGVSLNHMSNGSSQKPNNGINTLALSVGARYNLTDKNHFAEKHIDIKKYKKFELLPTISIGRNHPALYYDKKFWSGSITLTSLWYLKNNIALGLGIDFIRHGGAPFSYKTHNQMNEYSSFSYKDYLYAGSFATLEYHLGSLSLYMAPGYYLYYKTKPRQPLYARLGVRQKIYKNICAHFGIKANYFVAEFIEFGFGYRLKI
jgi:hypothetical protein